jgi:hypothetical protein
MDLDLVGGSFVVAQISASVRGSIEYCHYSCHPSNFDLLNEAAVVVVVVFRLL